MEIKFSRQSTNTSLFSLIFQKESISFEQFAFAFFDFLHLPIEPFSLNYKLLYAITKDIGNSPPIFLLHKKKADNGDDSVTIENFSKLLEWFGPMSPLIMEKVL